MLIVHMEHNCPLCTYLKVMEEEKDHADEALKCLETADLAMELQEVATKMIESMERLRK
tara:strand:+ start:487 stop:663 length:177 start_codon:yes stop_codon:yes gene_type:complete